MNYYKNFLAVGILSFAAFACQSAFAQQDDPIVVVNQDGEEVDAEKLKLHLRAVQDDNKPTKLTVDNGKITIVNEDGTTREIDVTGARSIVVNKSVESIIEDGQEKNRVRGKAIVIGPDGVRQEFDLKDGDLGQLKIPMQPFGGLRNNFPKWAFPSELNMGWDGGKYMVGVNCQPVSGAMAAQLELPENTGLVVSESPALDSPAAGAGIQKYDILLYADQAELTSTKDLVEIVQKAGKGESTISFTILRKGKQKLVDIQPAERPEIQRGGLRFVNPGDNGPGVFKWDQIGPGMVFEGKLDGLLDQEFNRGLIRQTEEMHRMMEEQAERLNQLQKQFKNFEGRNK